MGSRGSSTDARGLFFSLVVASSHASTVNLAHACHPQGLILLSNPEPDIAAPADAAPPINNVQLAVGEHAMAKDLVGGSIPECARQLCRISGATDPAAALLCGSSHPAELLGLANKGRLTAGADADLVLFDPDNLSVRACFAGGRLAWSHPDLHGAFWFHA